MTIYLKAHIFNKVPNTVVHYHLFHLKPLKRIKQENILKLSSKQEFLPTPKMKKCENSKRFSDEQVKLLDSAFKRGAKLEPRMKLQLARDLGLQPRQVSIWFQNKRARWKSKHIEQEYRVLKSNFDALYKQFDCLKTEKESLLEQLQTLRRLVSTKDSCENGSDKGQENGYEKQELTENNGMALNLDDEEIEVERYFRLQEEPRLCSLPKQGSSSLPSPEKCHNLGSDGCLDESYCPSTWWDF